MECVRARVGMKKLARVLSGINAGFLLIWIFSSMAVSINEVTILEANSSYTYTIPSFTAITLKLRHLKIAVEEEAGPVFYDSFFNEEHGSFQDLPRQAIVSKGCFVVSFF